MISLRGGQSLAGVIQLEEIVTNMLQYQTVEINDLLSVIFGLFNLLIDIIDVISELFASIWIAVKRVIGWNYHYGYVSWKCFCCTDISRVCRYLLGCKKSSSQCARTKTPRSYQRKLSESAQRSSTFAERPQRKVHIGMFWYVLRSLVCRRLHCSTGIISYTFCASVTLRWSSRESISELWSVTCHRGSHSVTCHPTQVNAARHNPSQPG